ncbi:monocarboxylate transporter 12-like isoform X2 [Penaeus japonicus]|uniref:monocarboxylate transporter 12-like isoform X2 n=1 Tax=Penaeus japonicus TaxID=27405 RepID=UPI001C70F6C2|nr:monocarboxylate transporter 12-like isoform X2 [Penaeus japonicus]
MTLSESEQREHQTNQSSKQNNATNSNKQHHLDRTTTTPSSEELCQTNEHRNPPSTQLSEENTPLESPTATSDAECGEGVIAPRPPDEGKVEVKRPSSSNNLESQPVPPSGKDEGYAWVVVFTVFLVNVLVAGYVKSFGILYILILESFPDASGAAAGWILGLLVGCRGLLAAVMGAFTVLVGPRACVILGALFVTVGLLAAVPAASIVHIAFTLGALVGVGLCMSETPGYLAVTDYFQEKRSLANGFRAAGNPLGGVLFSPLVVALHQHFGLRGALVIMAGIMLHMAVFGALMRPFQIHQKLIQAEFWNDNAHRNTSSMSISQQQVSASSQKAKKKKPLNFHILKNPAYLVYLVMVMCVNVALPNALLYTPVYGKSIGLSAYENSVIASYTSACDFVMRLLCGWTTSLNLYQTHHGLITGLVVGGIGCLLIPLCNSMWQLLGAATLLSFCMAFFWTLINVLLADHFGGEAMASTWGFFRMTQGVCSFLYPSLLGLVIDTTGGLTIPFVLMGTALVLGGAVFSLRPLIARVSDSKRDENLQSSSLTGESKA